MITYIIRKRQDVEFWENFQDNRLTNAEPLCVVHVQSVVLGPIQFTVVIGEDSPGFILVKELKEIKTLKCNEIFDIDTWEMQLEYSNEKLKI